MMTYGRILKVCVAAHFCGFLKISSHTHGHFLLGVCAQRGVIGGLLVGSSALLKSTSQATPASGHESCLR